jgi:hypothetical protein
MNLVESVDYFCAGRPRKPDIRQSLFSGASTKNYQYNLKPDLHQPTSALVSYAAESSGRADLNQ